MNVREKFLATMDFDLSTPPPLWEMAYWISTVERWSREGMAGFEGDDKEESRRKGRSAVVGRPVIRDRSGNKNTIGLEEPLSTFPGEYWIYPRSETQILEDLGDRKIIIDDIGVKMQIGLEASIPLYLEWPVTDRETWERYKAERFDVKTPGRIPKNLDDLIDGYGDRDYCVRLGQQVGFFGPIRYFLGEVRLLTCYYDDPDLIRQIVDDLLEFFIAMYSPILQRFVPDMFTMWEDTCYKTGPLISPDMFREYMLPAYKKFTSFLRDHGVNTILVDTDGDCWKLIPLFIEGGVTGIYPFEVAANMDVVEVRKHYPRLQMIGGIDKRPLIKGRQAIDEELDRRIPYMLTKGGYVPYVDHHVPPDVSLENFVYYREKLNAMIEKHYSE